MLLHLPDDTPELPSRTPWRPRSRPLPEVLRATLTWDQGIEMAKQVQVAAAIDMDIYFCDPHAPWQRATNENTVSLMVARLGWSGRLVPAA